ncbi:MAG: hypothetical protein Q4B94_08230 [Pseudomonadota bacterium]|nr:hypothetical protein [Pseudomonadota bacterium]
MFLHMLSSGEKCLFLKLASLFSVSDSPVEVGAYSNSIQKTESEEKALNGLRLGCEIQEDEYEDDLCQEQKFLESLEALPKSSVNSQLIRKEICAGLLKDVLEEENISLSASSKKIFIFELMMLGLVDGEICETEQYLLYTLAEELRLERDDFDDVLVHCKQVNSEVRKALSLILE